MPKAKALAGIETLDPGRHLPPPGRSRRHLQRPRLGLPRQAPGHRPAHPQPRWPARSSRPPRHPDPRCLRPSAPCGPDRPRPDPTQLGASAPRASPAPKPRPERADRRAYLQDCNSPVSRRWQGQQAGEHHRFGTRAPCATRVLVIPPRRLSRSTSHARFQRRRAGRTSTPVEPPSSRLVMTTGAPGRSQPPSTGGSGARPASQT